MVSRACGAGRLVALVISDVLGDPLDLIASGPTVDSPGASEQALALLDRYGARDAGISPRIFAALAGDGPARPKSTGCRVTNLVIGNNTLAVEAAGGRARQLGYEPATESAPTSEGAAEAVGRRLAKTAQAMRAGPGPDCLVSGGEPTVKLVDAPRRGLGGRNQQLVLAAVEALAGAGPRGHLNPFRRHRW